MLWYVLLVSLCHFFPSLTQHSEEGREIGRVSEHDCELLEERSRWHGGKQLGREGDSRCRQPWQCCRAALVRGQAGREQCSQCAPHKGAVLPPEQAHPLVPAPSHPDNARKARVWAGVPCSSPPRAGTAQTAQESWWKGDLWVQQRAWLPNLLVMALGYNSRDNI